MLRDYQKEIIDRLPQVSRGLVFTATGLGKTYVAAYYASQVSSRRRRVLFIAPSAEICREFAASAASFGTSVSFNIGGVKPSATSDVMAATFAALVRPDRRLAAVRFDPDVVIVDEAHYASPINEYETILSALGVGPIGSNYDYPNKQLIFMTATPRRGDGIGLGHFVNEIVCNYSIEWGVNEGWLVRPLAQVFSYTNEVSEIYAIRDALSFVADNKLLPSIVFVSSVRILRQIEDLGAMDLVYGVIHSDTSKVKRNDIVRSFREGSIDVLFLCRALTEGVSFPLAKSLIIATPTESPIRYTQMLGRILRPIDPAALSQLKTKEERLAFIAASDKPVAHIIDLVPERENRSIITFADISRQDVSLKEHKNDKVKEVEEKAKSAEVYIEIVSRDEEGALRIVDVIDILPTMKKSRSGFWWVRLPGMWATFYDDMDESPPAKAILVPDSGDFYVVHFGGWSRTLRAAVKHRVEKLDRSKLPKIARLSRPYVWVNENRLNRLKVRTSDKESAVRVIVAHMCLKALSLIKQKEAQNGTHSRD
jgi:superfamily II DNA or RNA helicase